MYFGKVRSENTEILPNQQWETAICGVVGQFKRHGRHSQDQ